MGKIERGGSLFQSMNIAAHSVVGLVTVVVIVILVTHVAGYGFWARGFWLGGYRG